MKLRWIIAAALVLLVGGSSLPTSNSEAQPKVPPAPEKRVALVIGIGNYKNTAPLANPPSDARAIGEALRRLNFEVDEAIDSDFDGLKNAVRDFGRLKAAKSDVALVFYAGHGVQVRGENYLLPANANLQREFDLVYEAIKLDVLMDEVAQAKKLAIVLLDACRNNPFTDRLSRGLSASRGPNSARGGTPGLARVDNVRTNTVVVLATRADEVADDGPSGQHSPFATALLQTLRIPGLELSIFIRQVRDTVLKNTDNKQEPFQFASISADQFFFNPQPANQPPVVPDIKPMEITDATGPTLIANYVPRPYDPDDDPLQVRIIDLPKLGEVRIDGTLVKLNDMLPLDRFMKASYVPRGTGAVGTLSFVVDDGRGLTSMGVLPITVTSSNRPPVVENEKIVRIFPGALNIEKPTDPDGDTLTVTVTTMPRGVIRYGTTPVKVGDKLRATDLPQLTYWSDPNTSGEMGVFGYVVEDGRGGKATSRVQVQVAAADERIVTEEAIWQRIYENGGTEDIEAFLKLFPNSALAEAARARLKEIAAVRVAEAPPPVVVTAGPAPPPEPTPRAPAVAGPAIPNPGKGTEQSYKDCEACPVMVRIKGGSFQMGDQLNGPPHRVTVKDFSISQYPVTVGEWRACMNDGACTFMPKMFNAADRTPIYNVSWDDAQVYIAWLAKRTGKQYRLPSEAEWEDAARGGTTTAYWWGKEVGSKLANCADCGEKTPAPLPVGSFQANPFGVSDVHGGVAQWVQDCYAPTYQGAPVDGSARDQKNCQARVLRSGSWRKSKDQITVTSRGFYEPSTRYIENGFRVAAD